MRLQHKVSRNKRLHRDLKPGYFEIVKALPLILLILYTIAKNTFCLQTLTLVTTCDLQQLVTTQATETDVCQ